MADVTMPQLGETVTEGTITRWNKKVGDAVAVDEVLFEVSTDKVDSEVPSPVAGVLSEIRAQEGDTVEVGAVIAVVGSATEQTDGEAGAAPAPAAAPEPAAAPAPAVSTPPPALPTSTPPPAPVAEAPAPAPSPTAAPAPAPANAPAPASADGPGFGGKVLSPVVRRMITEAGLDPQEIPGTGAGGRITRDDVQNFIQGRSGSGIQVPAPPSHQVGAPAAYAQPSVSAPAPAPAPSAPVRTTPAPLPAAVAGERDTVVPFSNIRRRTAEHMIMSKQTSAHTLVTMEIDFDNVEKVRKAVKERFKQEEGTSLTYLPFITRAIVDAVREFPFLNASVGNNELIVHRDVNVGIAVDLNFDGLLVPVVKGADGLRLRQIARGIADIAYRARNKKINADDITGGTITVTNAGGYGTFITYPVINQPQVAIISTDGVKKRPVAIELPDGTDAIAVHPVGILGLAWDHRAFDGAYASAFMAKLKEVIETRDWASEIA